jgi:hypothetical protein
MASMPAHANPGHQRADDEAALAAYATALADAIERALPGWVARSVERLVRAWQGNGPIDADVLAAAAEAGRRAQAEVGAEVRRLLAMDIDEQRSNPLMLLRRAVRYPSEVLLAAGVPEVVRAPFDERAFPDDVYGLAPASFADVDPSLHDPGLAWGAAKAHVHLSRRRAEGKR